MADCKACGAWFSSTTKTELCPTCERPLKRLNGYAVPVVHGQWIPLEYDGYADGNPVWDLWECSECREEHSGDEDTLPPTVLTAERRWTKVMKKAKEQRPIDAMRLVTKLAKKVRFGRIEYDDVLAVIADAPTVDAVEVVRCKDCTFYRPLNSQGEKEWGTCKKINVPSTYPNEFCSRGERREGE